MKNKLFNLLVQILLPTLTLSGQLALALKNPKLAILLTLLAQPFWFYSSVKSFKEAKQIGILITSIAFTIISLAGFINYWFL